MIYIYKYTLQMATWEYTEFKLKEQTGFILRNFENVHSHKGPYCRT